MLVQPLQDVRISSLPTRGGWIEISVRYRYKASPKTSLPTRGGWIEIQLIGSLGFPIVVPPHTGRVD